jgi:DNA-binding transcriptional ArsR family regulator
LTIDRLTIDRLTIDHLAKEAFYSLIELQYAAIWLHNFPMDTDQVFKALADPSRRELLDRLFMQNGQTLGELCAHLHMARQSVSKHLALLEAANLVVTVWSGRQKRHYLNPIPIQEIYDRWIGKYERQRLQALSVLKQSLEVTEAGASKQEQANG